MNWIIRGTQLSGNLTTSYYDCWLYSFTVFHFPNEIPTSMSLSISCSQWFFNKKRTNRKKNTFKLFVERLITTLRSIDIGIWILWYLRHLCMVGVIRGICMSYYTVLRVVLRICFRVRLYLGESVGWVTIQQANKNTQPHYTQKRLDKNNDKKRKTETKTEV